MKNPQTEIQLPEAKAVREQSIDRCDSCNAVLNHPNQVTTENANAYLGDLATEIEIFESLIPAITAKIPDATTFEGYNARRYLRDALAALRGAKKDLDSAREMFRVIVSS
jgi:hypothetical protein